MGNEKKNLTELPKELTISTKLEKKLQALIDRSITRDVPNFWENGISEETYIPVQDGKIRVLHYKPKNPISKRPLIFIPGWGVDPSGFQDMFKVFFNKIEMFYIETREKGSSKIKRWGADFTMSRKAIDIQVALKHLELNKEDFVIMGTCWSGAIILHGLINKIFNPTPVSVVVLDPMHTLWGFSDFFVKWLAPIIPAFIFSLIKPILKWFKIHKMKEGKQKERAENFIASAVLWKWRRAGIQAREFELFGNLDKIESEVFVMNGTTDLIHDMKDYPEIAKELPKGRFFYMKTDGSRRENLVGVIGREFAKINKNKDIPELIAQFEKKLERV